MLIQQVCCNFVEKETMNKTKYSVANRIKTIRGILGFKQAAVARMLQVTQQSYSQIENSEDIHTSTLYKVSEVLGIDAALIISQHIPINKETVDEFRLNNEVNAVVEVLDLRKKVVGYRDLIKSLISRGENPIAVVSPLGQMINA